VSRPCLSEAQDLNIYASLHDAEMATRKEEVILDESEKLAMLGAIKEREAALFGMACGSHFLQKKEASWNEVIAAVQEVNGRKLTKIQLQKYYYFLKKQARTK